MICNVLFRTYLDWDSRKQIATSEKNHLIIQDIRVFEHLEEVKNKEIRETQFQFHKDQQSSLVLHYSMEADKIHSMMMKTIEFQRLPFNLKKLLKVKIN
jgi:hypothetical protein